MPGNHNHYRDREFSRGHMSGGQTEKALRDIGQNVLDAARAALEAGANEVLADAKSRCPVKSGKLCDSIKLVRGRGGSYFKISANARNDEGFLYGQIVEFSPIRGRPFLYPSLDAHKDAIRARVISAIREACRRR